MGKAEELLRDRQNADGGFGPVRSSPSEVESTAIAAIALADPAAISWLGSQQDADGAFRDVVGDVVSDRTPIAAVALSAGPVRERALDHLEALEASGGTVTDIVPHDTTVTGWPWTEGALGWTEPTSWGLIALRTHRSTASERIEDAIAMLRDRECVGGGWNYGNREVFDVELTPYVQTTALALLALHGLPEGVVGGGLDALRKTWEAEAAGLLSLASACAAFRLYGDPAAELSQRRLQALVIATPEPDTYSLAWSAIALGDGVGRLTRV